ncbi:cbb3-type cytochrome c oxidase subunit I [Salinilacihabitans rarus]|uniref:cbb3-type cytochrome c oxidase subunit I n=1 Tax=Salinilacihabitans rarus TaxID=2961596 RepID=UPI0020C87B1C|nr:cbb3-type cytochrome c oxidase subunit I [Salinilacihabitans rarus]
MNAIPGGLRTDQQPPMAIPLRHFVVALAFLVVGVGGGAALAVARGPGLAPLAHRHALLVGWIALTIMGAMTQFVPVWSGVTIHSRRLAVAQLWLAVAGLVGFLAGLLAGAFELLPAFAAVLAVGILTFVYNVGRTLLRARPFDTIERHFALALVCFALVATFGLGLAVDFTTPVFEPLSIARSEAILVHATLALYGAVLLTVIGALGQLAKMFTQATLEPVDDALLLGEEALVVGGLAVLVVGRGTGWEAAARVGGLALLVGVVAFAVVIARLLARATVDPSPMTRRYWVVVASLIAWAGLAAPAWWDDPASYATLFGHPEGRNLLLFGVLAFVVVGSLYHIVPFIIWIERYSDRIGLEKVPMIDDLYDDRLERADFAATLVGAAGLVAGELLSLAATVRAAAGLLATVGFALFVANLLLTIHRHGPGLAGVLAGDLGTDEDGAVEGVDAAER